MSAAHTPGPWEFKHRAGNDGMYRTEVFSATHGGIATCAWTPKNCGNGVTATYREANARLIAAAPDLLGALRGLLAVAPAAAPAAGLIVGIEDKHAAAIAEARAATAKATGEAA